MLSPTLTPPGIRTKHRQNASVTSTSVRGSRRMANPSQAGSRSGIFVFHIENKWLNSQVSKKQEWRWNQYEVKDSVAACGPAVSPKLEVQQDRILDLA